MKNILIAYDGSESSKAAIKEIENLTIHKEYVNFCLFSVSNISNPYTNAMMQRNIKDEAVEKIQSEHDEKVKNEHVDKIKNQLNEMKIELEEKGMSVETKVIMVEGNNNPGENICEYAQSNGFDMIVVGSRGLGNVKKVILGSVSNYIVNNCKTPVLVVK